MQKRKLRRTNLEVSVIGFGGIPIIKKQRKAYKMIRRGFDWGINHFNTARANGDGEEKLSIALKDI